VTAAGIHSAGPIGGDELAGAVLVERVDRTDVTVEQLLAHRSGIGNYVDEEAGHEATDHDLLVPVHELATTERYVRVLDGHAAKFAPDDRFS